MSNIELNHSKEFEKIQKIAKELSKKEKGSRQYNILNKRIIKAYEKLFRYRKARYNEKSLEFLEKIKNQ